MWVGWMRGSRLGSLGFGGPAETATAIRGGCGGRGRPVEAKFSPSLQRVLFASYSGSAAREFGEGIALIPGGAAITRWR